MKGVSVKKLNGRVILVNAVDEFGNGMSYPVDDCISRGYEPDYVTLPDEDVVSSR